MAKVLGIGGIFFKSKDPAKLRNWYKENLGMEIAEHGSSDFDVKKYPENSLLVWSPFKSDTKYFEPSTKEFMINLIVDNLDEALEQVKKGGAVVMENREKYDFGSFGWFIDPDGNKIELWEPAK